MENDPDASVLFKLPVAAELLPRHLLHELQASLVSGLASGKCIAEQPPPAKLRQQVGSEGGLPVQSTFCLDGMRMDMSFRQPLAS